MTHISTPSRRGFLKASAALGAFTLAIQAPFIDEAAGQSAPAAAPAIPPEVNAWVVVKADDTVVIRIARSEMGQGTLTGLAQLVAEELDCDWAKVTTEYPSPTDNLRRNRVWGDMSTGGSRGIRASHDYVRKGGAAAKIMLVQAAAEGWKVPAAELTVSKGTITHAKTNRRITYGKVAAAAARLTPPDAAGIALKDPKDWKIAGKPLPRLDTRDKVNGRQVYGADLKLPGMLNAAIKDCPVFGGKVRGFNAAAAMAKPGVKHVFQVGESAVAVVAQTWWQAKTALEAVQIDWDEGPNARIQQADIDAMLTEGLTATQAYIGNKAGDMAGAMEKAVKKVEATYSFPLQNHATMEPMNATAVWTADKCEVWCPTQNGDAALAAAAAASGHRAQVCEIHKIHLGGGFGRRGWHDYVTQAVQIAKQMPGVPVKLLWSREEDMLHGRFHPITQCRLTAGLDADGKVDAMHVRISGQSIVAGIAPNLLENGLDSRVFQGMAQGGNEFTFGYGVPNLLIDHAMRNTHVPPGFWRGVNLNQNAVYMECFIDEVAHAAGKDPLEFRRALLARAPKQLAVLNAVADKGGWGKPAPAGHHRGLAAIMGYGSYVAACAEVSVSRAGEVKVHKITAATDPGHAVNPQQIAAQVEGSFVYGLGAAFYQECTVKNGHMEQENFDTYQALRMDEMPAVESIVMPSGGFWGGVGEPTIAVAAPAVLNAIFAATGKRVRRLPLRHADLKH